MYKMFIVFCVVRSYNSSITTIMCQVGSYRIVVGQLVTEKLTIDTFYQRKPFVYSVNVLKCILKLLKIINLKSE